MNLERIAIFVTGIVLIGKLLDLILGSTGRMKAKDLLVVNPWIQLESFNLIEILSKAASNYELFLEKLFGKFESGRSFIVYLVLFFLALYLSTYTREFFPNAKVVKPVYDYIPPDAGGIIFIGYIPTYISFAFTRWVVKQFINRSGILSVIFYILGSVIITSIMIVYIHFFGLLALKIFPGLSVDFPFIGNITIMSFSIPATMITILPPFLLLFFLLFVIITVFTEKIRKTLKFVLEKVDENNSSPVSLIFSFIGLLYAFITAIINYYVRK